jgi:mRNA-degrading endonuclease RelE of RelBE toxin-antitoxin system
MTPGFRVEVTRGFDRQLRKLARRHGSDLLDRYERVVSALEADPFNRTRRYDILKLEGVPPGYGQYRMRAGRFRFRYDVEGQEVFLKDCSLRREDTYR